MEEQDKELKMAKGLFTSSEEIAFQNLYVLGNIKKVRDPNAGRNPAKSRLCYKKPKNVKVSSYRGRTR